MKRSAVLAPFITAFTLWAAVASAAEPKPFTQQDFDKLAHDDKPVVVDVSATWCPTCKAQKPIVDNLSKQSAYKDVAILSVDFDADKAILKQFKVNMQSTLIAFKGGKEMARSVGDTTPAGIENIFKKAAN
ncbi:MAG: thioredoxin family protein [Curvibacter lanceolatus]|jgi:thiol-disulfide isomerase/thioredoxin|uniref:thioredoxin family protein n=1 Tax=Curvibacter lanceolatus TaxID=86182 RepID=UPI002358023C|nr:thioredoxin family protein [Curvibacter lanceolatus]MBV5292938.1 thioredoxin family protein [Curvibacter lanceolatus]